MATVKAITIEYGHTFNLGNYSSVKPVVTLHAELAEGDPVDEVGGALMDQARLMVERVIDQALVKDGKPPKFSDPQSENPF